MDEAPEPVVEPAAEPALAEAPAAEPVSPAPKPIEMTLDEWCNHHVGRDKRHELIGGFRFVEMQAGRLKDTAQGFVARFDAFAAPAPKN